MPITAFNPQIPVSATRERLLSAAFKVFSRDGLHSATTRAIAQEAGVNEVTLFRHFKTKEGLLEALITSKVEAVARQSGQAASEAQWGSGSLRVNLLRFAEHYYALVAEGEAFARTMIGEARRYPEHAQKMIIDAAKPLCEALVANLETARKAGKVRRGIDLAVAASALMDMLLAGMLRHTAGFAEESTPEQFIATCVDIFAAGLGPKS